jgi:phage shock protein PspC (stress-responsive transcriptional regulator)
LGRFFYPKGVDSTSVVIFTKQINANRVKAFQHIERSFEAPRDLLEKSAFGVCQQVGEWIGIPPARIRLYFIYASFVTFGSPFVLYLVLAFWINIKKYIAAGSNRFLSE